MDETDVDNDPVVQEFDVYLSKQLSDTLLLFNYPVRLAKLPYDEVQHVAAKMKPIQQKVELELAIDTRSSNYSHSHGEQIATNVEGLKAGAELGSQFPNGLLEKQTLMSSTAADKLRNHAVGAFRNGELHLTPIKGIVEMRPNLPYLDQADASNSKAKTESGEANDDDDEEEAKIVRPRMMVHESDEAKAKRLASYEFLRRQQEDEEWVKMRHHGVQNDAAARSRERLFAELNNPLGEFYMTAAEYAERLMAAKESEKPVQQSGSFSLTGLKSLALIDQVTAMMSRACVIQFEKLMSLLPKGTNAASAVQYLQQVAVLINGCWVVKSEVLYPKNRCSTYGGVASEKVCRVRDYILWKFSRNESVTRKELDALGKLPMEDEVCVLQTLAKPDKLRNSADWIFALEMDHEFIRLFPEVVARQEHLWEARSRTLANLVNSDNHAALTLSPRSRRISGKGRKVSEGERMITDQNDSDAAERHSKPNAHGSKVTHVNSLKRPHDVEVFDVDDLISEVVAHDTKRSKLEPPSETDGLPVPVSCIKAEPHRDVDGVVPSPELREALTNFVQRQLHEVTVLWPSILRLRLQKHLTGLSPGHVLGRGGISDPALEQSLIEAGGLRTSSSTADGEPVFVLPRRDDGRDPVRTAILDLLNGKSSLKIGSLRKKLTDANGVVMNDNDLKKVLKEFCETRGGCWHLRGTIGTEH